MIILAIIVGILICVLIILGFYFSDGGVGNFDMGMSLGMFITILIGIEVGLVSSTIKEPKPSALDVYRGNTELEVISVNGTPIDTVVVFKKELKY